MTILSNFSIKTTLLSTVSVLAFLLLGSMTYSIISVHKPLQTRSEGLTQANKMADYIITATSEQAKERGFTAAYITSYTNGKAPSPDIYNKIQQFREVANPLVQDAFKIAEQLVTQNWGGDEFSSALQQTKASWENVVRTRQVVDKKGNISLADWVKQMSSFIANISRLRQFAFVPSNHLEGAIYNNAVVKQAIWAISEYAGRERAILASYIAESKVIPKEKLAELNKYRGIVDFQLDYLEKTAKVLLTNKKHQQFTSQVNHDWTQIQTDFLGSYQQLRGKVYLAAVTGKYPITASAWLGESTRAINVILKFNQQISMDASHHSKTFGANASTSFWISIVAIIISALIVLIAYLVINSVVMNIGNIKSIFTQVVDDKDISLQVSNIGKNELGQLANAFNTMMTRMQELISSVTLTSTKINENVHASVENIHSNNKGISKQEADTEQLATAMSEMVASIQSIAESSLSSAKDSSTVYADVKQSGEAMRNTSISIHVLGENIEQASEVTSQLADDSQEIGHVLEVIKGIAEQTNLLALNAAIEAARAGEQGRGFAVVADEVRTLAGKTHESTEDIQNMIERLQAQSKKATDVIKNSLDQSNGAIEKVNHAEKELLEIINSMTRIMDMNNHIATATEEQGSVADEMNGNVYSLQTVAETNRELSQESVDSMSVIEDEILGLVNLVKQYKN